MEYVVNLGKLWLLWMLLCWSTIADGSVTRIIGLEQGLNSQMILATAEDSDGLLWAATEDGLYRLSDRQVRRVDRNAQQPLADATFRALVFLSQQHLLVSTLDTVAILDIHTNRFELLSDRFTYFPRHISTNSFRVDSLGQVWFVSDNGQLYRLDPDLAELTAIAKLPAGQRYRQVERTDDGHVFVAAPHQLWQLDESGNSLNSNIWNDEDGEITHLTSKDVGSLLVASTLGLKSIAYNAPRQESEQLLGQPLRDVQIDGHGNMWLLGRGQVWRWPPDAQQPQVYELPQHEAFDTTLVMKLMVDSQQRLWLLSSYQGLMAVRSTVGFVDELYRQRNFPQMKSESIWHIWANENERLLASDGGVQWFNADTGDYRHITLTGLEENGAAWAVIAQDEQTWLVGSSAGLYQIDRASFIATPFIPEQMPAITKRSVYLLIQDDQQTTYLVTDHSSYRWPKGGEISELQVNGKQLLGIRNVRPDDYGRLWVAGEAVLGYFDEHNEYHSVLALLPSQYRNGSFSMILPISEERIWFGNFGHGIWQYDLRWHELNPISDHFGLTCDNANFATSHLTQVLIGCDRTLYRIDPLLDEVSSIDRYDGLPLSDFNEGAMFYQPDLGFMVGSTKGMAVLDPDKMFVAETSERVLVESLQQQRFDGSKQLWLRPELNRFEFEPGTQLLTFQFATNRLLDPSPKAFRYRLNLDDQQGELITLDHNDRLTFGNLKAGSYELELYGAHKGSWQMLPNRVRFQLHQEWWKHLGVQLFLGGLLVALLLTAIFYLRSRLVSGRRALKQLDNHRHKLQLALAAARSDSWEWQRDGDGKGLVVNDEQKVFSAEGGSQRINVEYLHIHPDDKEILLSGWINLLQGNTERFDQTFKMMDYQGQWRWLHASGTVIKQVSGSSKARLVTGIYTDVSENRRLQEEHSLYAMAFEHAGEGALILDQNLQILGANPAAASILKCSLPNLKQSDLLRFWQHDQRLKSGDLLSLPLPWNGECMLRDLYGSPLTVIASLSLMLSEDEPRWVLMFSDISESKRTEVTLQRLTNFDSLTGLLNRGNFNEQAEPLLEHARAMQHQAALLFLDLDGFKHINESYGHSCGDSLLIEAAKRLQLQVGYSDLLCRFGGDEFVILMPKVETSVEVQQQADRILQSMAKPFELDNQQFYLSTSIGIACWPQDADELETMIKNADLAMYHAKEQGRGRYCFYTQERNDEASYQFALDGALREALLNDRLQIYFQPQLDLSTGSIVGVEALMRWFDGTIGAIPPDEFITLAESNGFITKLDRWALKRACSDFVQWSHPNDLKLAVNISSSQFRQPDFVDFVKEVLEQTGMAANQLCIEITEGVLMQQVELVKCHLQALRLIGVRVAIDDFGTGFSSLTYLSQLAVDQVKIDRSFVESLPNSGTDAAIVQTVIDLGRNLNLEVIAEGVENSQQQEFLMTHGCHFAQGFGVAEPMSSDHCQQWLTKQ